MQQGGGPGPRPLLPFLFSLPCLPLLCQLNFHGQGTKFKQERKRRERNIKNRANTLTKAISYLICRVTYIFRNIARYRNITRIDCLEMSFSPMKKWKRFVSFLMGKLLSCVPTFPVPRPLVTRTVFSKEQKSSPVQIIVRRISRPRSCGTRSA